MSTPIEKFVALSVQLCGISRFDLMATGYAGRYFIKIEEIVGAYTFYRMLDAFAAIPFGSKKYKDKLRSEILQNAEFGPVAENMIRLWFTAVWNQLPHSWRQQYGERPEDRTFVPFPYAYKESLLGPAVGSHPAGAKPTGHQSWILPPFTPLEIPSQCI